jgi:DMSO/TMAO reductase YedYZ molybdopterin-dependent catalytic subunit
VLSSWIRRASLAGLLGLIPHYALFYLASTPLLTESIAEWIMAHTPNTYSVWLLDRFGAWAKPFAMTGGLATLGFGLFLARVAGGRGRTDRLKSGLAMVGLGALIGVALALALEYPSWAGGASFWLPALLVLVWPEPPAANPARRTFLGQAARFALPAVMSSGTIAVAAESFFREERLARTAVTPTDLFPHREPNTTFGAGLVRRLITPIGEFYGMSKNTVDPSLDPRVWRLKITVDGQPLKEFSYQQLLTLPREERYQTLRCVSNTLKSNLMGNAYWSGVRLSQLVDRTSLPAGLREVAILGVDGHGDSLDLDYAFSGDVLFALGMNGQTLNRTHGFPVRLLCPRYYGFKNVKWIGELRFVREPYFGTWPKMGYTKEPRVNVASYIDKVVKGDGEYRVGGVSFAGDRPIQRVQVRADQGEWVDAELEPGLSRFTWIRWVARVPGSGASQIEARAQDSTGHWQESQEGPLFPAGVTGPTVRRV